MIQRADKKNAVNLITRRLINENSNTFSYLDLATIASQAALFAAGKDNEKSIILEKSCRLLLRLYRFQKRKQNG